MRKFNLNYLFYLILIIILNNSNCYERHSKCLVEKTNMLTISCPVSKITRIVKAFYGYSWSGDCHFIEKDCIVDVPNDDLSCLGEGCSVKIIESPIILQECWSLMASYIQVDYECIPVEQLQNMCSIQESEFSVGYIVTPDYPSTLVSDLSCPCTVQAPLGYTVMIEVLDFRLPGCSQAGLTIWSDTTTFTHCLSISTGILPGSGGQNISMRLHSQNKKNNAGFLLKYYTSPQNENAKIKFVCYGSVQLWQSNQINQNLTPYSLDFGLSKYGNKEKVEEFVIPNNDLNLIKNITKHNFIVETTENRNSSLYFNSTFDNSTEADPELFDSFKLKQNGAMDWTIVIISVVASVIFLLILINALIWFIFSLKGNGDKKMPAGKLGNPNLYPDSVYVSDYYKSNNFLNDEEGYGNALKSNSVLHEPMNQINLSDVYKPVENHLVYGHQQQQQQQNYPNLASWRRNNDLTNNYNTNTANRYIQYGFNTNTNNANNTFEKREKIYDTDINNPPEDYAYLQRANLDKYYEKEKINKNSNHPPPVFKPSETNYTKQAKEKKKPKAKQPKEKKTNSLLNWTSKYPSDGMESVEQFENPAMIIDEDNLKHKQKERTQPAQKKPNVNNEFIGQFEESSIFNSASQVPINVKNPSYLYEEQEDSVDLRSECSAFPRVNSMFNRNENYNISKLPRTPKHNEVNSWRDVY